MSWHSNKLSATGGPVGVLASSPAGLPVVVEDEMSYGTEDARFDAEQQGRCPLCGRTWETGCPHCEDCGKVRGKDGYCTNPNCDGNREVS